MLCSAVTPQQITTAARMRTAEILQRGLKRRFSDSMEMQLKMFDNKDVFDPAESDESFVQRAGLVKTMMLEWNIPNYVADMLAKSLFWRADFRRWLKESVAVHASIRRNSAKLKVLQRRKRTALNMSKLAATKLAISQDGDSLRELRDYKAEVAKRTKLYLPHFVFGGMLEENPGKSL